MFASTLVLLSYSSTGPPARPKQADLPVMVHIDWRRAPDIPKQGSTQSGFQDSDGGWLDDTTVLTAFGYSSGGIPGFLNTAWILNSSLLGNVAESTSSSPNTTCSFELGGECSHGYKPLMCYTAKRLFPTGCAALSCHGLASVCDDATGFCVTNSTPKTQPCISQSDPPAPPPPSPPAGEAWEQLPSAPVCGRQEVSAAIIDGAAYYVGGFSYIAGPSKTHPYCFNDTLKLSRNPAGEWEWTKLPDFPYVISSYGLVSVGTRLYLVGGADYDSKGFYVMNDRHGNVPNMGARMYTLDTRQPDKGWERLADMPGVPRWVHSVSSVNGQIYVIGGALTDDKAKTHSVVDNWKYSPGSKAWSRLADLPISSGNFQTNGEGAFMDRYIILVGGYQYGDVAHPSSKGGFNLSTSYGTPTKMCNTKPLSADSDCLSWGSCPETASNVLSDEYFNGVFVYDTETNRFGIASASSSTEPCLLPHGCGPFPMNDNLPQTNVRGNKIFAIGGECDERRICGELYQHYPTLALIGTMSVVERP